MGTILDRTGPFPTAAEPLLEAWHTFAAEVMKANEGALPEKWRLYDGAKPPVGPRQWRDNGGYAWCSSLVVFLPVELPEGEKRVNHHITVEWQAQTGRPFVIAGNHLGDHVEMMRGTWSREREPETFLSDLRATAKMIGLL